MLMMMICSVDAQVLCECTIKPLLFSLSLLKFAFFRRNVLCSYMYVTHSTSLVAVASVVSHRHKQMFSFTKKKLHFIVILIAGFFFALFYGMETASLFNSISLHLRIKRNFLQFSSKIMFFQVTHKELSLLNFFNVMIFSIH